GITSLACEVVGLHPVAVALLALNVVFYPALWLLTLARIDWHRDRVVADLMHHGRSVGFFTTVAATCVLGSQLLVVAAAVAVAVGPWLLGIVLWAILTYGLSAILFLKSEKPPLAEGINGGWLLAVVAAQSVSVLGAQLAPHLGAAAPRVLFF